LVEEAIKKETHPFVTEASFREKRSDNLFHPSVTERNEKMTDPNFEVNACRLSHLYARCFKLVQRAPSRTSIFFLDTPPLL